MGELFDEALFIFLASPPFAAGHGVMAGPGRAGRRRQASIAASHVQSLAVLCAEERNPRSGRRPAIVIKFTLGLQLVCRK